MALSGSDQLGLRKLEVIEGATVLATKAGTCVDWSVRPCAEAPASAGLTSTTSLSGLGLSSGTHALQAAATDGAGNLAVHPASATVKVDNDAPVVSSVNGSGVSGADERTLTWTAPAGGSPIVSGSVELCATVGNRCERFGVAPGGPFTFAIGAWGGDVSATVRLTDLVGNVGDSAPVRLQLQATPTPTPIPTPTATPSATPSVPTPTPVATPVQSPVATPSPTATPTPTPALKRTTLRTTMPAKLRRATKFTIRGTVSARSTKTVTVVVSGKRDATKRFRITKRITPNAKGSWSTRIALPNPIRRISGLSVAASTTPRAGWSKARPTTGRIRFITR